jgi:hypothetical protein
MNDEGFWRTLSWPTRVIIRVLVSIPQEISYAVGSRYLWHCQNLELVALDTRIID